MTIYLLLALIAFAAGAVVAGVTRQWVLVLVATGLFLLALPKAL